MKTYTQRLIDLNNHYWDKNPIVASMDEEFNKLISEETNFLNHKNPVMRHRMYCVLHNITEVPKCECCDKEVALNPVNAKKGFRKLCSEDCRLEYRKISKESQALLDSYEWLYEQRIVQKKSKEKIAEELGVTITPVNKAIKALNIPKVRYNESDYKVKLKLEDKDLLEGMYEEGLTLDQIAEKIGSSQATVSLFFAKHGIETRDSNYYERNNPRISQEEQSLVEWIKSVYSGEVRTSVKGLVDSNLEVDIYIPEKAFAIEYNGLYSHIYRPSEQTPSRVKGPYYHIGKTMACRENGVFLFHLWSDLWVKQREKIEFYIMNKLDLNKRIYARECEIREVDVHEKNTFLNAYHLQGEDKSKFKYGLYYKDELVSLMTFSIPNRTRCNQSYDWELKRFCSKGGVNVVGGFSKLLNHFRKSHVGKIVSYADMSYSDGGVYKNNGFKKISESGPSYQYVILNKCQRIPKTLFKKGQLIKDLGDSVEEMSEKEIMEKLGIPILFDCGTETYVI